MRRCRFRCDWRPYQMIWASATARRCCRRGWNTAEPRASTFLLWSSGGGDFFPRKTLHQCHVLVLPTGELMESTPTFAGSKNLRIIINNFLFFCLETMQNLTSFNHADLALHCPHRLHALNLITFPDDLRFHNFFQPSLHLVTVFAITSVLGKVLSKSISPFVASTSSPIFTKFLPSSFYNFPYIIEVFCCSGF